MDGYAIYNNADLNTYRSLNYSQASNLSDFYKFDYTGNSSDYYYYGYNKSDFEDLSLLLDMEYIINDVSKITLKPYYWQDKGDFYETITTQSGANRIRNRTIDHDMYGVLAQYSMICRMLISIWVFLPESGKARYSSA
jgi:iron complex outermembrane receptor protein